MSSREKILARRAKFIAAAIASAGAISCSDSTAQVCLEPAIDAATDTKDAAPMPCLDPVIDTGVTDTSDTDTGPAPCLKMAPDAGEDG